MVPPNLYLARPRERLKSHARCVTAGKPVQRTGLAKQTLVPTGEPVAWVGKPGRSAGLTAYAD